MQNNNDDNKQQDPATFAPPIFPSPDDVTPPMTEELNQAETTNGSAAPTDDIVPPTVVTQPNTQENETGTKTKTGKKFGGGKGKFIATILGIFLLVGSIGAGVILVQQQQDIREKAGPNNEYSQGGKWNTNEGCTGSGCVDGPVVAPGGYTIPQPAPEVDTTTTLDTSTYGTITGVQYDPHQTLPYKAGGYSPREIWNTNTETGDNTAGAYCGGPCPQEPDSQFAGYYTWPEYSNNYYPIDVSKPNDGGGETTAAVTPTTPPITQTAQCLDIKAYDINWSPLTSTQLSQLTVGDIVRFTAAGQSPSGTFTKARFTINGILRSEVATKKPSTTEFYDEYTVPTGISTFNITAQVFHDSLGWK